MKGEIEGSIPLGFYTYFKERGSGDRFPTSVEVYLLRVAKRAKKWPEKRSGASRGFPFKRQSPWSKNPVSFRCCGGLPNSLNSVRPLRVHLPEGLRTIAASPTDEASKFLIGTGDLNRLYMMISNTSSLISYP